MKMMGKYLLNIICLLMFTSCSLLNFDQYPNVEPNSEKTKPPISSDKIFNKKSNNNQNMLENAQPFFPMKETLEDIQIQIDDLRSQILDYETRISVPEFNQPISLNSINTNLKHQIKLKNGTIVQGSIIQENIDKIYLKTQIGQIIINKVDIDTVEELAKPTANITFDGDFKEEIYSGKIIYTGSVKNEGLVRADFVRIVFNLMDQETNIIATDSAFVNGEMVMYQSGIITDSSLKPGNSGTYEVEIKLPKDSKVEYVTKDVFWDRLN